MPPFTSNPSTSASGQKLTYANDWLLEAKKEFFLLAVRIGACAQLSALDHGNLAGNVCNVRYLSDRYALVTVINGSSTYRQQLNQSGISPKRKADSRI